MRSRFPGACLAAAFALLICTPSRLAPAEPPPDQEKPNYAQLARGPETLHYSIDWRVFDAGTAKLTLTPENKNGKQEWQSNLKLESSGVIAALYRVMDEYNVHLEEDFCATNSVFSAEEGKRNRETRVAFDRARGRASYVEKDRIKNSILKAGQTDTPTCVSDVVGGLYRLRTMKMEPGQSLRIPVSDGKKSAQVRVEAQAREQVVTKMGKFNTVRCEVFLFNGVLFSRRATLEIWMTDDERHLPVQLRVRLPILIGTITFQLDKEERS
ncbi:MAG TPA: DUF3108 domain-containing protein [Bryobacteraceae bacterium]|jgi:hypothetical protein|nr:DUF3108 domain-containing protein [Bryobacteraceae bacterium]